MVEHSPYHPKVEGLSLAASVGTGRKKMAKSINKGAMVVAQR